MWLNDSLIIRVDPQSQIIISHILCTIIEVTLLFPFIKYGYYYVLEEDLLCLKTIYTRYRENRVVCCM